MQPHANAGSTIVPRDLTDPAQQARVLAVADELVADVDRLDELRETLSDPEQLAATDPILVEGAACAASAVSIRAIATPVHLSIVWAMYQETDRIRLPSEHPHGEDFLREKIRQIEWLADHNSLLTWNLVAVDDGCPSVPSSGDVAEALVGDAGLAERVCVLRLQDAIDRGLRVTRGFDRLVTTDDSRKGGSIAYGMWAAINGRAGVLPVGAEHVVIYTDADLSANVAQAGSLVIQVLDGASAAVGQRYGMPGAVLVKEDGPMAEPHSTGSKPDKMIILFRHFVRAMLVPQSDAVLDTQAGFKAFRADVLADALPHLDAFTETFDLELLLHAASAGDTKIAPVAVVFTEDFAATNFPSVEPSQRHLDMVTQIAEIHDRLVGPRGVCLEGQLLRRLVGGLDLARYQRIIAALESCDRHRTGADPMFDQRWTTDEIIRFAESG
ncbi:MAG: hypothetical protein AAF567_12190 [Actinomycetota bacterium]